jgi:catalase
MESYRIDQHQKHHLIYCQHRSPDQLLQARTENYQEWDSRRMPNEIPTETTKAKVAVNIFAQPPQEDLNRRGEICFVCS